ncbi:MAG: DUF6177 family protein, partial [Actinomycetota bacterium]|nr:DUF6177 family protein [Actinomycetota bacterium]
WLVVVGDEPALPAVATVEVTPTATGIAERVRLTVGSVAPDTAGIDRLAAHIADAHPVRTMLASLHLGGRSGLIGSRFAGHPVPDGLLVRPEGVSDVGLDRVLSVPAPEVSILGRARIPAGGPASPVSTPTSPANGRPVRRAQPGVRPSGHAAGTAGRRRWRRWRRRRRRRPSPPRWCP